MIPNNTAWYQHKFSLSTAKIIGTVEAAAAQPLYISRIRLGNASNATNEQLDLRVVRITTKGDLAGTAAPTPGTPSDNIASVTCTVLFDCTETTSVYGVVLDIDGVASLAGYDWVLPEGQEIFVPAAGIVALELVTSITAMNATPKFTVHEL